MTALLSDIDQLRAGFSGDVLSPADEPYESARMVHNGAIDRRPGLITRCRSTADVVDAVTFAREHGMEVSVRGGGHNVAGRAVTDGGLMIDLSPMRGIHVDARTRTVGAQGGVTWREYNRAAHVHGLATTGGTVSTTGIAGLTLGGGVGWLMGTQGLAIDNLLSVEVVTADGTVRTVGEHDEPDLFWAMRGAGANFGVATWFEYRAHPQATVVGGLTAYPLEDAEDVLAVYRDAMVNASDELSAFYVLTHAPDGSGTKLVVVVTCHLGDQATADRELAPLRSAGTVLMDTVGPMPYPAVNMLLDDGFPRGARNYWKSGFVEAVDGDLAPRMVDAFRRSPSIMSGVLLEHYHGAATRVPTTATAYPHREPGFNMVIAGEWLAPEDDDANRRWVRSLFGALASHLGDASYVNYLDADDLQRTRAAYGPNWDRLVELKQRWDPDNAFHHNHNIAPGR
ncbi:FAD-binding oxidoreductase [Actinomycetospora lutea]|uniref:FAD-binding oxidoreductase n=1 Tax=Actinomycetospora lutea TaxID=663604 RepID=UPI0023656E11|nr:FAD-binding oxidoreductase [Actinomycetospora lutea]MDD7939070.1 FAD-binding oxidoreductase [Actinomycetospora lutea]